MATEHPLVLVVEDEQYLRQYLQTTLRSHGYRVAEAATWEEGRDAALGQAPDVILLDLGLPDGDGLSLARELRARCPAPIIVVSARGREEDKVLALDMGADDYVTKPFGSNELLARIRVALRHRDRDRGPTQTVLELGGLRLDFTAREVTLDRQPVRLTPNEFDLLAVLARHAGRVLTNAQLLREVWGDSPKADPTYLRVYMRSLRKKLEPDPNRPRLLQTELGVGYRFNLSTAAEPGSPAPPAGTPAG
jgi:two-component system KDP operon response regulator KdpE